ncbi:MAG: calcium/sodium antiporter [Acidobacteriota bacterium]|nr:calcium/sodium antiporter [Acidobacteriota bacterium]
MFEQFFANIAGLITFWPTVIIFIGAGVYGLKYGADWLVDGAANLGFRFSLSATMIGLTIVAFGTSAPELVVSAMTALEEKAKLCLGNVVGSNVANTSLILGATAIVFPMNIGKDSIRYDGPISFLAILLVCILALAGSEISRLDGFILLGTFSVWMTWLIRKSLREARESKARELLEEEGVVFHKRAMGLDIVFVILGLILLVVGAKLLVVGAIETATAWGVSETVVGLTVVALGTSLPELAVCLAAALRKHADITVGNVMGSNIFNALLILGVAAVIFPMKFDLGIPDDYETLAWDIPLCVALCLLIIPMMRHKYKLSRFKGWFLLAFYFGYIAFVTIRHMVA